MNMNMYLLRHQLIKMAVHLFFCVASTIIEYKAKKNLAEIKAANLPFGLEKGIKVKIKTKNNWLICFPWFGLLDVVTLRI